MNDFIEYTKETSTQTKYNKLLLVSLTKQKTKKYKGKKNKGV